LPPELRDTWVVPFYGSARADVPELEDRLRGRFKQIDLTLVRRLLACPDWRPRSVGAAFAALRGDTELTDDLGRLLLRSDVCFAGRTYCVALARFGSELAVSYLRQYLEYYLTRPDLWFDQKEAMAALTYVDSKHGTTHAHELLGLWHAFVANKPNWNLALRCEGFADEMRRLDESAARLASEAGA
jgi:hypothetical protein